MNTTELIEIARECCSYPVKVSDYHWCGEGEFIFNDSGLNAFAQRIEQPHLQRIAELELALQKQAKAALLGMDAAKANGDAMLKAATEIQSQLKPELLDSERQANAVLTEENEKLQQRIAEIEQELHYAKQAARVEADMCDQARSGMKQLREALLNAKAMGFFIATNDSGVSHRDLCKAVDRILEETK